MKNVLRLQWKWRWHYIISKNLRAMTFCLHIWSFFFMFYLDEDLNFTNNFGIIFFKIQTYMEDSKKKTTIIYHCSKCGKFLLSKTGASLHNCIGKINRNQNLNDVHKRALESFFQASNRNIANTILWSCCRAVICSSFKRRNVQF